MKSKNIVIHIGLHKTGTTFLQKNYFAIMDNMNFMGNTTNMRDITIRKDVLNIISNESFCCSLPYTFRGDREQIVGYLKGMFPDARIIVGTREKKKWFKSTYSQFLIHGGTLTFDEYRARYWGNCIDQGAYVRLLKETWDEVFTYDFKKFCEEQDDVMQEISEFIGVKMKYRFGVKNHSLSRGQMETLRRINKVTSSHFNDIPLGMPHILLRKAMRLIRDD